MIERKLYHIDLSKRFLKDDIHNTLDVFKYSWNL